MWSQITLKTKIIKHRLIMCQCEKCGKKKLSQRKKKSNKVLSLIVINACIWLPLFDGLTSSQVMVFENAQAAVFDETNLIETAQSVSGGLEVDGTMVQATSVADTLEVDHASPVQGSVIEEKIRKAFGDESRKAIAVAKCESRLDPSRVGDKHMAKWSYGIFQVNQTWHKYSVETLLNPDENIRIAKDIRDRYGWDQWTCHSHGFYEKYL